MPSFDEFLRSGQVGELSVGMTKVSVRALLGPPDSTSISMRPEICKYGSYELSFWLGRTELETRLDSINLHIQDGQIHQHPALTLSGWMPTHEESFDRFSKHLEQIDLAIKNDHILGPDRHLVLQSGVKVAFHEGHLWSVHYSDPSESILKQMSISVDQDDFDLIRREAKARGLSASALCSQWVKDRVANLNVRKV